MSRVVPALDLTTLESENTESCSRFQPCGDCLVLPREKFDTAVVVVVRRPQISALLKNERSCFPRCRGFTENEHVQQAVSSMTFPVSPTIHRLLMGLEQGQVVNTDTVSIIRNWCS